VSLERQLTELLGEEHVEACAALGGLPCALPADLSQARAVLALAKQERARIRLMGFGSKLAWQATSSDAQLVVSTRRMSGVVEFEPGDGTLTALAGTPLAELRRLSAEADLELTPDVPRPQRATLGGVLAAGASGPDRTRHGAARLHVLGTRTLLANGEETRSGGRLVKNVTGYDLHRLYCGSHGSLAMITEASLRLFPASQHHRALRYDFGDLAEGLAFDAELAACGVAPRTATLLPHLSEAAWSLHVGLAGREAQLDLELERCRGLREPQEVLDGSDALERSDHVRDAEPSAEGATLAHLTCRPSRLRAATGALFDALGGLGHGASVLQPRVASLDLALVLDGLPLRELAERIEAARRELAPLGARLELRGPGVEAAAASIDESPAALTLMRRLKQTYDPSGLWAGGSLGGRIQP
jgi:glycolate oxidase FAD binding subunit